MIYIGPPYNTSNDFIYPDNYSDSLQTYLEFPGQPAVGAEVRRGYAVRFAVGALLSNFAQCEALAEAKGKIVASYGAVDL